MENSKNIIIAVVFSIIIMVGWQFLFPPVKPPIVAQQDQNQAVSPSNGPTGANNITIAPSLNSLSVAEARQKFPRIAIESPNLGGSINLQGLAIDELYLTKYNEKLNNPSQKVHVFEPKGTLNAQFGQFGFSGIDAPNNETIWRADKPSLRAGDSVQLTSKNANGVEFIVTIALDNDYMFTITQSVHNGGKEAVQYAPYNLISKNNYTVSPDAGVVLHEGLAGVINDELIETDYQTAIEKKRSNYDINSGGWLGFTNKYFQTIMAPDQSKSLRASMNGSGNDKNSHFQVDYIYDNQTINPGETNSTTSFLFAGAKELELIKKYQEDLKINKFELTVDFGRLYILTKPFYYILHWLYQHLGNFGLAIMGLTIIVKIFMLPLAWKSQVSMSKMKILQPKMEELKKKFGSDNSKKTEFQTALMELYKKEKINPLAGCLPMLVQIPVFFALYKTLYITLEMRHAPFYGWIHDLSAPDPFGILTLFGLIMWDVPQWLSFINLGIWPLILGVTMWGQQALNPAPTDPIQAKVFQWMPILFTFMLAPFAAGLVIYWAWNNALSILQQWLIMRHLQQANPTK